MRSRLPEWSRARLLTPSAGRDQHGIQGVSNSTGQVRYVCTILNMWFCKDSPGWQCSPCHLQGCSAAHSHTHSVDSVVQQSFKYSNVFPSSLGNPKKPQLQRSTAAV